MPTLSPLRQRIANHSSATALGAVDDRHALSLRRNRIYPARLCCNAGSRPSIITPVESVEKAVQLIKGGFSFRAKKELKWSGDIWQQGFTDHRIRDEEDWVHHLEYIRMNPVRASLADAPASYPFMAFPNQAFPQGLKPEIIDDTDVRAEARTLQPGQAPSGSREQ